MKQKATRLTIYMSRCGVALVFLFGEALLASSDAFQVNTLTPPVGARVYIVPQSSVDPVEVISQSEIIGSGKIIMRDPLQIKAPFEKTASGKQHSRMQKPKVKFKPSKLRFPKEAIAGRYAKPRVEFERIGGAISHASERANIDLKARILDDSEKQEQWLQSDW